jgi:hypothetical protein
MAAKPTDIQKLFEFYTDTVKPLYNAVQLTNALPQEVLFELNASLDHIARIWTDREKEEEAIDKAYSHLKRSCLDIFKMAVKEAMKQFEELRKIDTSIIDNGDFDRQLMALSGRIRDGAKEARQQEGHTKDDANTIKAFDMWVPVFADCVKLEKEFYRHNSLNWAKKKQRRGVWRERLWGFLVGGILVTLISSAIYDVAKQKIIDEYNHRHPLPVTAPALR